MRHGCCDQRQRFAGSSVETFQRIGGYRPEIRLQRKYFLISFISIAVMRIVSWELDLLFSLYFLLLMNVVTAFPNFVKTWFLLFLMEVVFLISFWDVAQVT